MTEAERLEILSKMQEVLDFALFTIDFAKTEVFPKYLNEVKELGVIKTGFIGTVDEQGAVNFYDGKLRLMKPDGTYTDFDSQDYCDHLAEHVEPYSMGKMPYARSWNEGFSLDLKIPRGFTGPILWPRINVADKMATPRAQAELEEFREKFGRPAQYTLLHHWARLDRRGRCLRARHRASGTPLIDQPRRPGQGRAQGRAGRRLCRGPPLGDSHSRLHHR